MIQHLVPKRPVETLHIAVLVRLPELDVLDRYPVRPGPLDERLTQELRTVVGAQAESAGHGPASAARRYEPAELT
jgi:hypothetical protein